MKTMGRFGFLVCLALSAITTTVKAQCSPTGTYYTIKGTFPLYSGATRTLTNTASDTIDGGIPCRANSISFTNDHLKVSGTPAGTVNLYVSANNGVTFDPTPVATYTVTASSTTVPQTKITVINNGSGNPYTNYRWIWTGTGTMVGNWKITALVRFKDVEDWEVLLSSWHQAGTSPPVY